MIADVWSKTFLEVWNYMGRATDDASWKLYRNGRQLLAMRGGGLPDVTESDLLQ